VTPTHTFYTTPQTPYDIRYTVVIEQKTTPHDQTEGGKTIDTVMDGTINPWDMDPTHAGRQVKGTWKFGINSAAGPPPSASRRGLVETYE